MTSQPPPYSKDQFPYEKMPTGEMLGVGQAPVQNPQGLAQVHAGYPLGVAHAPLVNPQGVGQVPAGYPGMPVTPIVTPPAPQQPVVVNQHYSFQCEYL